MSAAPGTAPAMKDDRDYLDKGVDAGLKKFGGKQFSDPHAHRAKKEKLTDFIRKQVEKFTGYRHLSPFFGVADSLIIGYVKRFSLDLLTELGMDYRKKLPAKVSN